LQIYAIGFKHDDSTPNFYLFFRNVEMPNPLMATNYVKSFVNKNVGNKPNKNFFLYVCEDGRFTYCMPPKVYTT
jgi:hypothetical protein